VAGGGGGESTFAKGETGGGETAVAAAEPGTGRGPGTGVEGREKRDRSRPDPLEGVEGSEDRALGVVAKFFLLLPGVKDVAVAKEMEPRETLRPRVGVEVAGREKRAEGFGLTLTSDPMVL